MNTSPKNQLLTALAALEQSRKPSPAASRRQFTRYDVRGDAELIAPDRNQINIEPIIVMLRDVSRGGIGFVADSPVPSDSIWRIQFQQNGYDVADMNIVVRFSKLVASDIYLCGAQICVRSGIMCLLGIDAAQMRRDESGSDSADFVGPDQV